MEGDNDPSAHAEDTMNHATAKIKEERMEESPPQRPKRRGRSTARYQENSSDRGDHGDHVAEDSNDNDDDEDGSSKQALGPRRKKRRSSSTPGRGDPKDRTCPHCKKVLVSKGGLAYHLKHLVCQTDKRSEDGTPKRPRGRRSPSSSPKDSPRFRGTPEDRTCPVCNRLFTSILGRKYHVEHGVCLTPKPEQEGEVTLGRLHAGARFVTSWGVVQVVRDDRETPYTPPPTLSQAIKLYNRKRSRLYAMNVRTQNGKVAKLRARRRLINTVYERKEASRPTLFQAYFGRDPCVYEFAENRHERYRAYPEDPSAEQKQWEERIVECVSVPDERPHQTLTVDGTTVSDLVLATPNKPMKLFLQRCQLTQKYNPDQPDYICSDCGRHFQSSARLNHHQRTYCQDFIAGDAEKRRQKFQMLEEHALHILTNPNDLLYADARPRTWHMTPGQAVTKIPAWRTPRRIKDKSETALYPEVLLSLGFKVVAKDTSFLEKIVAVKEEEEMAEDVLLEKLKAELQVHTKEYEMAAADQKFGAMYNEVFQTLGFRHPRRKRKRKSTQGVVATAGTAEDEDMGIDDEVDDEDDKSPKRKRRVSTKKSPPPKKLPPIIDTIALVDEVKSGRYRSIVQYTGDDHGDTCISCCDGGELLCCDYCPAAEHLACLRTRFTVKDPEPDDDFMCHKCISKVLLRRARAQKRQEERQERDEQRRKQQAVEDSRKNPGIKEGMEYPYMALKGQNVSELIELLKDAQTRLKQSLAYKVVSPMSSAVPPLDFAALLSREYRPARLSQLAPKERSEPIVHKRRPRSQSEAGPAPSNDDDDDDDDMQQDDSNRSKKEKQANNLQHAKKLQLKLLEETLRDAELSGSKSNTVKSNVKQDEETARLVLQLVSKTPTYTRLLKDEASNIVDDAQLQTYIRSHQQKLASQAFPPEFHQVELADWESKIQWEGYKAPEPETSSATAAPTSTDDSKPAPNDASQLLAKRRNPFLEDIDFDNLVSWSGSVQDTQDKASNVPLILELGVAGQSIAKHVLPSHRPLPCVKSDEYQLRMQKDWDGGGDAAAATAAELSKGTLHADKEKLERLIKHRQEKRRQMAKDKTNRVTEAMGTLNILGSGRGRTITSSLMGPGGTERTGRPSRHVGANASHDNEYVEQLDMVTNHQLVRDLGKVTLRQYHRPKLPLTIVRTSLIWQFNIRYIPATKKGGGPGAAGGGGDNSSSYQAMMMGTHAGAISKAKLRTESDLSPTEGNLVLLEYSEERPPIPLTKGMASKIVTYYRGDKTRCPVSAGGGDRPTRRKRPGDADTKQGNKGGPNGRAGSGGDPSSNKPEMPPKMVGPNHALTTTITDWVGKAPKKTRDDRGNEREKIDILPEGVTEILHPKVHGPFIGEIEDGQAVTGLVSNLFVAPIYRHEPEQTDFLMILGRNSGASIAGRHETLSVILRDFPTSIFTVGQTEPRTRVFASGTQGEKNFIGPFVSYQIARALSRTESREGHGLRFDEIQERVLPNLGLAGNNLRQRLKHVANYDKNSQIWSTKAIGFEDYPGVDALGKQISPEGVAAWEVASAAVRRLNDLGVNQLFAGSHTVSSVGVTMIYLAGQVNATRELARKMKKLVDVSRSNKNISPLQLQYYEKAAAELDMIAKAVRQRHEVAKFIYEELQLAPWHLTGEFIDVHKKGEGTGMMKLTGLGDPSGIGEGYSFLREQDSKPSKSVGAGAMQQSAQMKKITGTEDDLRKLTMKQMARILRSYGMAQKQIDTLKRWDRVHVIRDLSTKAASDGIGDGLERFARGEKLKLSEQKQMYRDRIQVIWKRQLASLAIDSSDGRLGGGDGAGGAGDGADEGAPSTDQPAKKDDIDKDESDSESDDDFMAAMEEEMLDRPEANMLVAAQAKESSGASGDTSLGQLRTATQDKDLSGDARELAALKRQREEERAAREGLSAVSAPKVERPNPHAPHVKRKIIRRRVTKTYPDGRQVTTFEFIVHPEKVGQIMARLEQKEDDEPNRRERPEYPPDEKQVGHSWFEDDDDFDFSRGRGHGLKRRGAGRRGRTGTTAKALPRKKDLQFGKLKNKVSTEQRLKKRKREEDELELYATVSKRKGTSNRKERGSIRERRPHVIMADRLEGIRAAVELRPSSVPFHKPVNRRILPQYYEKISHPIDLSTIRDKIQKYEYRTADAFLKDFELMKSNAIKFNGAGTLIAEEGCAIYDIVKEKVAESRAELTHLEEAVQEQMSGKPKKKKKKGSPKSASTNVGFSVDAAGLDDIDFNLDDIDSDSE
eukprot:Nitzschia sp. Nitz4//scaffold390_size11914//842//8150//NITZ4_009014-RA/size11914-snap-gene-0.14-mRNA-1//-1//CDS//3329550186//4094//frame0